MSETNHHTESSGRSRRLLSLTRGDKRWAFWFLLVVVFTWVGSFLFGLVPSLFGNTGLFVLFGFLGLPLALLLGLLLVAISGPFFERRAGYALAGFLSRLGMLVASGAVWVLAAYIGGGPWSLGRLHGAKWGTTLGAIRKLQASSEVEVVAHSNTGQILDPIPAFLHSTFWGEPRFVSVEPRPPGPPAIIISWGGGFHRWGIAVGPGGHCPLDEDTYKLTSWADDVWVFQEY